MVGKHREEREAASSSMSLWIRKCRQPGPVVEWTIILKSHLQGLMTARPHIQKVPQPPKTRPPAEDRVFKHMSL